MGWDTELFLQTPSEQLVCSICHGVLEDPMHLEKCDHTFCKQCIQDWLKTGSTCPIDREEINNDSESNLLKPVTRLVRGMLEEMLLRCPYNNLGCDFQCQMVQLSAHLKVCDWNPSNFVVCQEGCGQRLRVATEVDEHNCATLLLKMIEDLRIEVSSYKQIAKDLESDLVTLKSSMQNAQPLDTKSVATDNTLVSIITPIVEDLQGSNVSEPIQEPAHPLLLEGAVGGEVLEAPFPATGNTQENLQYGDATPKIVVIGGKNSQDGALGSVELYDLGLEAWGDLAPLALPRVGHCAVVHNNTLYILGGKTSADSNGNTLDCVDRYDAKNQRWNEDALPAMREPRAYFAAIVLGDSLYAVAGEGLDSVERYNFKNPSAGWTAVSPLPNGPRQGHGIIPLPDNSGFYLFGGSSPTGQPFATAYQYNAAADRWSLLGEILDTRLQAALKEAALCSCNGYIYAMGGGMINCMDSPSAGDSVYAAASKSDAGELEWFPLGELPSGQTGGCRAVTCGGKFFLVGGYISTTPTIATGTCGGVGVEEDSDELSAMLSFDPAQGAWFPCDPMSRPRVSPAVAVVYI